MNNTDNYKKIFEKERDTEPQNKRSKKYVLNRGRTQKYEDILKERFKIFKLVRIERKYNPNVSTSFKRGDITSKTIEGMIKDSEMMP